MQTLGTAIEMYLRLLAQGVPAHVAFARLDMEYGSLARKAVQAVRATAEVQS